MAEQTRTPAGVLSSQDAKHWDYIRTITGVNAGFCFLIALYCLFPASLSIPPIITTTALIMGKTTAIPAWLFLLIFGNAFMFNSGFRRFWRMDSSQEIYWILLIHIVISVLIVLFVNGALPILFSTENSVLHNALAVAEWNVGAGVYALLVFLLMGIKRER